MHIRVEQLKGTTKTINKKAEHKTDNRRKQTQCSVIICTYHIIMCISIFYINRQTWYNVRLRTSGRRRTRAVTLTETRVNVTCASRGLRTRPRRRRKDFHSNNGRARGPPILCGWVHTRGTWYSNIYFRNASRAQAFAAYMIIIMRRRRALLSRDKFFF